MLKELDKSLVPKIVLVICAVFLVCSMASTSVTWIEPTSFGLASELPIIYFIGLFLLGCVWYIGVKSKSRLYLPAALILTVSYLYIAPAVVRVPVWISNSYYPFGESLLINEHGHLVANPSYTMVSYRYWPLFLYFASAFTQISGIPHDILLKFFPLLTVSMYGLLAFLILRVKLPRQYAYVGSAVVLSSLFIRQQYFGPQAISYILFLAILLVVSLLYFEKIENPRSLVAILFLLFVVITFMHPLTSFMTIAMFFAFYLADRFTVKKRPVRFGRLFLVAIVIWLAYNSYSASSFFDTAIQHYSEIFSGTREITIISEGSREIASTAMRVNFFSSWSIVLLCGVVAALSLFTVLRKVRVKRSEMGFPLFNAFMLIMFGSFAFVGEYGAVEAYQRAFMFSLVPLSFLAVYFLAKKPKILIVFVAILIFLNIPAQYGSDTYRIATPTLLEGMEYTANNTPDKITLIGDLVLYMRYFNQTKMYKVINIGLSSPFSNVPNSTVINEEMNRADYVIHSNIQYNIFMFYLGRDPLEEANINDLNRIYDNGGFRLMRSANAA